MLLAAALLLQACAGAHIAGDEPPSVAGGESPGVTAGGNHGEQDVLAPAHWSYLGIAGPAHWAMLSPDYRTCEAGSHQSPVNIAAAHPVQEGAQIRFIYDPARLFAVNNGHTIQVSHETGCHADLGNNSYSLRQFHFHAPSEHHIHGRSYPMELHLVHQDDEGRILVIAVLLETGAPEPVLAALWSWLPDQVGEAIPISPLNLDVRKLLPDNTDYFTYSGSLTTPPCTEGVHWAVIKEPIQISDEDVRRFIEFVGYNARPVQPLGDRQISEH